MQTQLGSDGKVSAILVKINGDRQEQVAQTLQTLSRHPDNPHKRA